MSERRSELADSPSDALSAWMSGLHLHRLTWLIVIAALLHLVGDTVYAVSDFATFIHTGQTDTHRDTNLVLVLAGIARTYGYSLTFFGTAAIVEYLFRIWDELRIRRFGVPTGGEVPPPSEL